MESEYRIIVSVEKGDVEVQIEGLTDKFQSATNAAKQLSSAYSGVKGSLKGSVNDIQNQIDKWTQLRDRFATNSDAVAEYNEVIAQLKVKLTELKSPVKGTLADLNNQIRVLKMQQTQLAKSPEAWADYEKSIAAVKNEIDTLTNSTTLNVRSNQDMISSAGLAGATVVELGRTVSDANYGIKGMANNLSQLSTLFITLMSKAGGAKNAIGLLLKQINGPLGWILAFQTVITLLEAFADRQSKAEKEVKSLSQALLDQTTIIQDIFEQFELQKGNDEERLKLIRAIAAVDKDLAKALEDNIKNEDKLNEIISARKRLTDANVAVEKSSASLKEQILDVEEKRAKAQTRIDELNDLERKKINLHNAQIRERGELREKLVELEAEGNRLSAQKIPLLAEQTEAQKAYDKLIDRNNKKEEERNEIAKVNVELQKELLKQKLAVINAEEVGDEEAALKRINKLKAVQLEIIELEEKDDIQKAIKEKYSEEQLQKIREIYSLKRETLEGQTNKAILKAKKDFQDEALVDLVNYYGNTYEEDEKAAKERLARQKWAAAELKEGNKAIQEAMMTDLFGRGFTGDTGVETPEQKRAREKKEREEAQKRKQAVEQVQSSIDAVDQLFQSQFDKDIAREEAKTQRINNELRKRLSNENLTAKQREAINNQIAANEAKLQEKRDEIAEKNFKLQKAINIANALVETYRTGWLAFGSQLVLGDPTSAIRAKIAQAVTLAAGLANVAMIAKQQFVPSESYVPSGASGGGAPNIQAPDFNIVGQSGINQLSQALQAQTDKPVKAYVVSKDISTAQELDRNKVLSSGL